MFCILKCFIVLFLFIWSQFLFAGSLQDFKKNTNKILDEVSKKSTIQKKIIIVKNFHNQVKKERIRIKSKLKTEKDIHYAVYLSGLRDGIELIELDNFNKNNCINYEKRLIINFNPTMSFPGMLDGGEGDAQKILHALCK